MSSYTVFALKWRPRIFEEIVGQPHVVSTLSNAIQKNRLAHAYLFAGPRGVGKTSTARILARALNCQEGPTATPCGKCFACQEITAGRSLDVIEIDGASNRGIDEIRTLRENVKFAPTSGKFKIYIIDEVHQITADGFNALLKTLEEPPEFVKFIFATTAPHKVPATILSRCQRLDFRRISVMETVALLEKIVKAEGLSVDKEVLAAIAKASDGALRDAESILDQLVSYSRDKVTLKDVVSMLGMVEQDILFSIADAVVRKDARSALDIVNSSIDNGKDPHTLLSEIIEHFRNLMVARVSKGSPELIDLPKEACERILQQAQGLTLEEIFNAFTVLINAQDMSKRLESIRIPIELALVKLCRDPKQADTRSAAPAQRPSVSPAQMQKKEQPVVQKTVAQKPVDPPVKEEVVQTPAVKPAEVCLTIEQVQEKWQQLVTSLSRVKMSVSTYLNEGTVSKVEAGSITVAFARNHSLHKEALETKENKALIEKHLFDVFGHPLRVNFLLLKEEKSGNDAASQGAVKSVMDMFHGRLI